MKILYIPVQYFFETIFLSGFQKLSNLSSNPSSKMVSCLLGSSTRFAVGLATGLVGESNGDGVLHNPNIIDSELPSFIPSFSTTLLYVALY